MNHQSIRASVTLSVCVVALFLDACKRAPISEPAVPGPQPFNGQIYRSLDNQQLITLTAADQLEMRVQDANVICQYTKQADTLRVVAHILGTTQAIYYRITPQGLVDQQGVILYESSLYEKITHQIQLNGAMIEAARRGDAGAIITLLSQGASTATRVDFGKSPLLLAIESKHTDAVEALLSAGVSANEWSEYLHESALTFAIITNQASAGVVKSLLAHGANPNIRDAGQGSMAPITIAAERAGINYEEIVKELLKRGVDPNTRNPGRLNEPLIMTAMGSGDFNMMRILVDAGADRNLKNSQGNDVYFYAANNREMLAALRTPSEREGENQQGLKLSKLLVGTWRYQDTLHTYLADGTTLVKLGNGSTLKEKWSIEGDILTRRTFEIDGRPQQGNEVFHDTIIRITQSIVEGKGLPYGVEWRAERVK